MKGSLTVAGAGIKMVAHITLETRTLIARSERLLYLVAEPGTEGWLRQLNPGAESLQDCFQSGRPRREAHERMLERVASRLDAGSQVCLLLYGHPGVFSYVGQEAVRRARAAGCSAEMLPGISAADCLFADLGWDPSTCGCQSMEATLFLLGHRRPDLCGALLLWQVGVVGQYRFEASGPGSGPNVAGLRLLAAELMQHYPAGHEVVLYEAANFPVCEPVIKHLELQQLPSAKVSRMMTLFVRPVMPAGRDADLARTLGLDPLVGPS